ncbi:hypothetical protein [Bradyrhizobium ottawaense]|uniref:hypothetical protein n=1 Tax=Bradyrhizobium ottawaense TaxID=931866 RepID=UPI003F9F46EE
MANTFNLQMSRSSKTSIAASRREGDGISTVTIHQLRPPAEQDDPEQSRAFVEKAREIEADEVGG